MWGLTWQCHPRGVEVDGGGSLNANKNDTFFVHFSLSLSLSLSLPLSLPQSVCLSVRLSVSVCVCLSLSLSLQWLGDEEKSVSVIGEKETIQIYKKKHFQLKRKNFTA